MSVYPTCGMMNVTRIIQYLQVMGSKTTERMRREVGIERAMVGILGDIVV